MAGHLAEDAELAGEPVTRVGWEDVVVLAVAGDGQPRLAGHLGSTEDDTVDDLVATQDGHLLLVHAEGVLTVGATSVAPRTGAGVPVPRAAALVTLDARGRPAHLREVPGAPREVVVAPISGGDVVVASSFTGDDDLFGHAVVERLGPAGESRWRHRVPASAVDHLAMVGGRLAVGIRADDRLSAWLLAVDGGGVASRTDVKKLAGTGDLGALEGFAPLGDGVVAFGETGDDVEVAGRSFTRRPLAIQPFALLAGPGTSPVFTDLADVVGAVLAVGTLGGRPAAVVRVLHGGPDPDLHRGVHVALLGTPSRFIPLSTHRVPGDDREHGRAEQVVGDGIDPVDAVFVGDGVAVLGRCATGGPAVACLARYTLGP